MRLYKTDKTVIKFINNAEEFLNGLTANEMSKPRNAFVSIHGKLIAAFDQVNIDEEEHWIVIEPKVTDTLFAHIDKYVKLSGVKTEILSKSVYFDLDGDYTLKDGELAIKQAAGQLIITDSGLESSVSDDEFKLFRVLNNIPVQGTDYNDDFLLNITTKDMVSFTKGCFLGQEPIAKVYNRSRPTWKLVVKNEADCTDEEKLKLTSKVTDPADGKVKGFVFVSNK